MSGDSAANSSEATSGDPAISSPHRRQFLKAAAVVGGVVGISGLGATVLAQDSGTTIKLGGEVAGWQGQAPSSINGETNPTLDLTAGEEVTVTWTNLDGAPHNFQVLDSSGSALHSTEVMSDQGSSQTIRFTATTEMTQYNCQIHPTTMVGDVSVSEASTQTPTQTSTETATQTPTETETETEAEETEAEETEAEETEAEETTSNTTETQTSTETATETESTQTTSSEQSGGNGKAKTGDGKRAN